MIEAILFDCDDIVIKREMCFTRRLINCDLKIDRAKILPFFENKFIQCEIGKADLKEELSKVVKGWGWNKSVEELMNFWFSNEAKRNEQMINYIQFLRAYGIKCYLSTNNEKYRISYLLDNVGLRQYFDGFLLSCEVGFLKKEKKFWQFAYRMFPDLQLGNILVWDDDKKNINSARKFGFKAEFYRDYSSFLLKMEGYVK